MYQTILVPLDGSELAERALPYAGALAKASGGTIIVMRVVPPFRFLAENLSDRRTRAMNEAGVYLRAIVARMEANVPIRAETYYDDPATAIATEVHRRPIDVLVMSTLGHTGPRGGIFGGVAEQVFRQMEIPALIVPPECIATWPVGRPRRILVPLDGSDLAAEVLDPAHDLAAVLGAELRLLRVVTPLPVDLVEGSPEPVGVSRRSGVAEATNYLAMTAAGLPTGGPTVMTRVVEGPNPVAAIASVAAEDAIDVIAMATHGRSGVTGWAMASVAAGTIQKATVPILLVRPRALGRATPQLQTIKSAPRIADTG
jgi:nucleotide-binding universal stress UspA family protein